MEECRTGCVKLVIFYLFIYLCVQNRFIFAMFCSVFIYLFVEHMISISPPIWRIRFFGKQNISKNRLHTCFDKKNA